MAKTKTPKKEKLVNLKPEKITNEQLEKLQQTVNNINRFQLEIGIAETRKHSLLHQIAGIQDELTLMQEEFEKDYGTIDINIHDGNINYPEESNPSENGETDKKD
tara:strand:- start:85 stop:399 length:315 start_codon:yes stop_codon:yes gene_type:complete